MSSDSELRKVFDLFSARVSLLEGRFGRGKAHSALSFVRGREEGAHNGRWRSKEADWLDLILDHIAENYPLEPLLGRLPQETPWFVINQFKRCAFNTTSFKTFLYERCKGALLHFGIIVQGRSPSVELGKLDSIFRAFILARNGICSRKINKEMDSSFIGYLLNDLLCCTYIETITHDADTIMDVMNNKRRIYSAIKSKIEIVLKQYMYSDKWVNSMKSEINEYESLGGSKSAKKVLFEKFGESEMRAFEPLLVKTEARNALLEKLKVRFLHYEENRSEEAISRIDESVRDIRDLLSGRREPTRRD